MEDNKDQALFSRPENDVIAQRSWKQFQRSGRFTEDALRRVVGESWRRCLNAHVDPSRNQAPIGLEGGAIAGLLHRNRELLEAGRPVLQLSRECLSETGTLMVLTGPEGVVLDVAGDSQTLTPAEKIHLMPGATWNEVHCGTNAIGTALSLEQPVQIHSEEHYCEGIKRWTCSATIIRHPITQEILGVLDVSGLSKTYNRQSLSLVVNSASRIETIIAKKEFLLRYHLLERCITQLTSSDPSIVLDRHGIPIKLNELAVEAIAKLGVQLNLQDGEPIAGLSHDLKDSHIALPEWLRREWIEPVIDAEQAIGTIVRLPPRKRPVISLPAVQSRAATDQGRPRGAFGGVVGNSAILRDIVAKATQLARSKAPVLLLGETGTGKEVFARGIHDASPVAAGPFIALNCGSLTRDLLASELFGYREGAFTGAKRGGMMGKIEAAEGGTLFLDELGEMPHEMQPQFLRVLEDGQIVRLGDTQPRKINFRLIAATNRDLRAESAAGRFRIDLFYRISVTSLRLPALRERPEDVRVLVSHFLSLLCAQHGVSEKRFNDTAIAELERHTWPGNVRELRNVVESLVLTVPGEVIGLDDLQIDAQEDSATTKTTAASASAQGSLHLRALEKAEFDQICLVLGETAGNATLAASRLGIAKSTLYVKLKRYGLEGYLASSRH